MHRFLTSFIGTKGAKEGKKEIKRDLVEEVQRSRERCFSERRSKATGDLGQTERPQDHSNVGVYVSNTLGGLMA